MPIHKPSNQASAPCTVEKISQGQNAREWFACCRNNFVLITPDIGKFVFVRTQVKLTNVAVVKMKVKGKRYEPL